MTKAEDYYRKVLSQLVVYFTVNEGCMVFHSCLQYFVSSVKGSHSTWQANLQRG